MRPRFAALAAAPLMALALTPTVEAAAAPKGQQLTAPCEKAKQAKLGTGFTCDLVYVPKAKTRETIARIEAAPSMEAALATAGGEGGTCSTTGCYQWFTSQHTGYDAVGSYGWRYSSGAYQRIGIVTIEWDDTTTSPYAVKVAPLCWTTTHAASTVYLIAELYWATTGGSNDQLAKRKRSISPSGTVLNNGRKCLNATGNSNGYGGSATNVLSDNTRAFYTVYHYMTWKTAGFSGKWYASSKSWIFGKPTASTPLKFFSPVKWPVYANSAAWLP